MPETQGDLFFCPLGGVITWHRAVEWLVSVSYCVIYILPLLFSYKHDDIVVSRCDKQHLLSVLFAVGGQLCGVGRGLSLNTPMRLFTV